MEKAVAVASTTLSSANRCCRCVCYGSLEHRAPLHSVFSLTKHKKPCRYHAIVWPLAIGQTMIWAAIFYLFPALLPVWEHETGWSKPELTGAFTLALLVAAVASPAMGRFIDNGRGKGFMLGGAVVAALALVALSQVTSLWQFYMVWFVLGLCMAASLYEPCFALLVRHLGNDAKNAITRVTLVAGLAGTVSYPTAALLAASIGWRNAVIVFAGLICALTLPSTWIGLRKLSAIVPDWEANEARPGSNQVGRGPFWPLAIAFTLIALNHGMIITHLLPLLAERGVMTASAVLAASLIGPMQVTGRIVMLLMEKRTTTLMTTFACFCGMILAALALMAAGANLTLVLVFVIFHGAAYGVTSIVRPVMTRELLGSQNFGLISGRIGGLFMLGTAVAPFTGALIWQVAGYQTMLMMVLALTLLGAGLLFVAARRTR